MTEQRRKNIAFYVCVTLALIYGAFVFMERAEEFAGFVNPYFNN